MSLGLWVYLLFSQVMALGQGPSFLCLYNFPLLSTHPQAAFVVVQLLRCVWLFHEQQLQQCATPRTVARQASLSFTIPKVCSNSCPLSRCCHPTILSSAAPFSSCPQSFPISWLFTSGGQSIGASASVNMLPLSVQSWFPLELTSLISLLSKELALSKDKWGTYLLV